MKPELKDIAEHLVKWNVVFEPHPHKLGELLHELPPSPLRWVIRTLKQGGWLPEPLAQKIARAIRAIVAENSIRCEWVTGVPNAGTEYARLVAKAEKPHLYHFPLTKEDEEIQLSRVNHGIHAVLVDDVIGAGTTKLRWIAKLHSAGVRVQALAVVIDREEGGAEMIRKHFQIPVISLFASRQLLELGVQIGAIDRGHMREALAFHELIRSLNGLVRLHNGIMTRT